MSNLPPNLLDYVVAQLKAGVAQETIRAQLGARGWQQTDIDRALISAEQAEPRQLGSNATPGNSQPVPPILYGQNIRFLKSHYAPEWLPGWIFRTGFASIFLINGATALLHPADFVALVSTFPGVEMFNQAENMVLMVGINDLILGLLILSTKFQKYVLAWAGLWLGLVSTIKLVSLI